MEGLGHKVKSTYPFTVTVRDATNLSDTQSVTVTVTDVEEAPEFPGTESGSRTVPENTAAGEDIGSPVAATDDDGDALTYTLGGTDAASFGIVSSTGQLQTKADLDHEAKFSYSVTVTATDSTRRAASKAVVISVSDVAECPAVPDRPGVSPDSASVTVTDDDLPPQPTELRVNGHIQIDSSVPDMETEEITLSWKVDPDQSEYTSGYRARYVQEICTEANGCSPSGGLENPSWSEPIGLSQISGTSIITGNLGGTVPQNPMTLYRIEVQAVNLDGEESDEWSDPAFAYPTSGRLTRKPLVARIKVFGFQEASSYSYTICIYKDKEPSEQGIPGMGAFDASTVIAQVQAGVGAWAKAIGDSSVLTVTHLPATPRNDCDDPREVTSVNQIVFPTGDEFDDVCWPDDSKGRPAACWPNHGVRANDIANNRAFPKQSIVFNGEGWGHLSWDFWLVNNGCHVLRDVTTHEVGHALGLGHPVLVEDGPWNQYAMGSGGCDPQPYDIVAAMANYQSRSGDK